MFNNKKLEYITVRYDCSDELAERICTDFNIEENSGSFVCINRLLTDDYSKFINFNSYIKPRYKKLIFINFIDIRKMYSVDIFNWWMKAVDMFDEIYDTHPQVEEYRPHIQGRVKSYQIEKNSEIESEFLKIRNPRFELYPSPAFRKNIQDHTSLRTDTLAGLELFYNNKAENLKIGRFCSFGENVKFLLNRNHNIKNISTHLLNYKYNGKSKVNDIIFKGDIVFDNDVWVGKGAMFLPNVHIGNGAVIGAGAVVTKDVPPYAVVAGNPAKVIKYRFDEDTVKKLLEIKWWDWPLYKVYDNVDLLDSGNIDELIKINNVK